MIAYIGKKIIHNVILSYLVVKEFQQFVAKKLENLYQLLFLAKASF